MKKYGLVGACALCLGIVGTALFYYVMHKENQQADLSLYGNVDVRVVDIGFRVPGLVTDLFLEEGDRVKQGELMTRLDKAPYNSQVKEAQAAAVAIASQLKNAEVLLERRYELINIGGVAQEDLDNAQTTRDQLAANLAQAEASFQVALDNLSYTEAYAPTDGIVLTRIREPGSVISPGEPIFSLAVSSPVWVRAFVDEPDLGVVHYGMKAEISTDIEGGPVYTGHVGFISPVAEFTPKTVQTTKLRTDLVYRLRIYVDNPDHYLLQGMPVTVKLKR